jgi:hypothetical protein
MSGSFKGGARITRRLLDTAKREIAKLRTTATGKGRATTQAILRRLKGSKTKLEEVAWNVLVPQIPILRRRFGDSGLEVSRRVRFAVDFHNFFVTLLRSCGLFNPLGLLALDTLEYVTADLTSQGSISWE